jgi:hypothetical protein
MPMRTPAIAGTSWTLARLAITCRRCDVILAMLRTHQPYQPTRPAPSLPEAA